jgi:hypothetical protein
VHARDELLRNGDFRDGLRDWRCDSGDVSLVESGGERLLRFEGSERRRVRIVAAPAVVTAGAAYTLSAGWKGRPEAEVSVGITWADRAGHEVSRLSRPLERSTEVTAPATARYACVVLASSGLFYLREVSLRPVGPRLEVRRLGTSQPVLVPEASGLLLCEAANTGSETIARPEIELRGCRGLLAPGAEAAEVLPDLQPGQAATARWPVVAGEPGVTGAEVRVRGGGVSAGLGANVVVAEPRIKLPLSAPAVVVRRSYVLVGTRAFRVVLPRMEGGFGVGGLEFGDPFSHFGWVRSLGAAIGRLDAPPRPLSGRRAALAGRAVVLSGSDHLAEWECKLEPTADRQRLAVSARYVSLRRHPVRVVEGVTLCLGDAGLVQGWQAGERECTLSIRRGGRLYDARLTWTGVADDALEVADWSPEPAVLLGGSLVTKTSALAPGRELLWQQQLWIGPASRGAGSG